MYKTGRGEFSWCITCMRSLPVYTGWVTCSVLSFVSYLNTCLSFRAGDMTETLFSVTDTLAYQFNIEVFKVLLYIKYIKIDYVGF
jgi:hypothetical protein